MSELDVSPKFFESSNWKEHLNSCLDLLLEDEESDPEEKELQVKAHKLKLRNDYVMVTSSILRDGDIINDILLELEKTAR